MFQRHFYLNFVENYLRKQIEVRDYPERDIWSLGVMVQGSGQMGELLGRRRRRRRLHSKIGVWNSFSFRAWIGLIWEISARKPDHSAWNFGARLFCKKYQNIRKIIFPIFPGYGKIGKSNFQYFQDRTESKKSVFQYFQDYGECCRLQFPIFPGEQ